MKRLVLTIGLALVFGMASSAEAGFLSGFTGNSVFGLDLDGTESQTGDGIVNFAVYASEDADWRDDGAFTGTGGVTGGLDGTAAFVYMYQVVNADINPPDTVGGVDESINSFFVPIFSIDNFTSAGAFSGFAFDESGVGATGPSGNLQLGTNSVSSDGTTDNAEDTPGDGSPTESGVALDGSAFVADDGFAGSEAVGLDLTTVPGFGLVPALKWVFVDGTEGLKTGQYSSVLVYTSNSAPSYSVGQLSDGENTHGDLPTVPAPAGLALVLAGLPGLLGLGWYQRRRKTTVA